MHHILGKIVTGVLHYDIRAVILALRLKTKAIWKAIRNLLINPGIEFLAT